MKFPDKPGVDARYMYYEFGAWISMFCFGSSLFFCRTTLSQTQAWLNWTWHIHTLIQSRDVLSGISRWQNETDYIHQRKKIWGSPSLFPPNHHVLCCSFSPLCCSPGWPICRQSLSCWSSTSINSCLHFIVHTTTHSCAKHEFQS